MFDYIWPIALVLFSNTLYQICAKGVPSDVSPFASLTVTYAVGALVCLAIHLISHPGESLIRQLGLMNWAPYVLGIVIVGLEGGWIYAYKAGWQVSTANIAQSAILAVILIAVGALLYKEPVTRSKVLGIAICLMGLVFINLG